MGAGLAISIIIIILVGYFFYKSLRKNEANYIVPVNTPQLLNEHVTFYNDLDQNKKAFFEKRVKDFLKNIAIRGIDVTVTDLDRVLVAAGAIIPIFAFPDWRYNNLAEVLLYNDTFSRDFRTRGGERDVLGMVGSGAMHREMILSLPSLRASFQNPGGHNTVIHEFAHLIDKADGETDGIPEYLLAHPYIMPWINRMHKTIEEIKGNTATDIDSYGATNDAEFFAVVSEYFFERPGELKAHHPELFAMLERMFGSK